MATNAALDDATQNLWTPWRGRCPDRARFVTGQAIAVDGGYVAQ